MREKLTMCCVKISVLAIVASLSAGALHGQTFGEITGRVTDSSGAVVPAASITLTFAMPYGEHHALQFRVEAFNVFNHPVWGTPNGNIRAGAAFPGAPANAARQGFGVISSTAIPMRQLQVGWKYLF